MQAPVVTEGVGSVEPTTLWRTDCDRGLDARAVRQTAGADTQRSGAARIDAFEPTAQCGAVEGRRDDAVAGRKTAGTVTRREGAECTDSFEAPAVGGADFDVGLDAGAVIQTAGAGAGIGRADREQALVFTKLSTTESQRDIRQADTARQAAGTRT